MSKSTFGEEQKNPDLMREAFPTFCALPRKITQGLWRGWKKSWHYLLTIVIVIAIAYVALDIYATAQLNHQLNLIRQKGEPLTMAEVAPPKVPDAQNAAVLYNRAVTVLESNHLIVNLGGVPNGRVPVELDKKTASLLAKNAQAVDLIRQATAKPQCRFDVDWQHWLGAEYPELGRMRTMSRLLSLQARYEAETGNSSAALQDVRRLYLMVQQMSGEKFLIGALSQRAMEAIANRTLAKVLLHCSLTKQQAREFQASLPVIDWNGILHRALLTERVMGIEFLDKWMPGFLKPFWSLGEADELRLWQEIIDSAINTPVPVPPDYGKRMDAKIQRLPWYTTLAKIRLPVFTHTRSNFDWSETQRREREIAFALAAYHSQYHTYPAMLQEAEIFWESTFPLDPYNNKPFRYKSDGKTFLLYSIGVNRKDDGGVRKSKEGKDDIIWGH